MLTTRCIVLGAMLVASGPIQTAPLQGPTMAAAAFEVVSVKPNRSPGRFPFGRIGVLPGGRFTAVGATLLELTRAANGLREDAQIAGGPGWFGADRFDVEAQAPAGSASGLVPAMLKTLLADRFKLIAHSESRSLPLYALVMARSDGKMGARLRRSGTECAPMTLPAELGPAPPPPPPPPPGAPQLLVARPAMRCGSLLIRGLVSAREITIEQFIVR